MALGVVLLVSLLSLGWRVGIVVAAAVPLTLAVAVLTGDKAVPRLPMTLNGRVVGL
jgi:hypothetical protein